MLHMFREKLAFWNQILKFKLFLFMRTLKTHDESLSNWSFIYLDIISKYYYWTNHFVNKNILIHFIYISVCSSRSQYNVSVSDGISPESKR